MDLTFRKNLAPKITTAQKEHVLRLMKKQEHPTTGRTTLAHSLMAAKANLMPPVGNLE